MKRLSPFLILLAAFSAGADVRWLEEKHDFGAFDEEMGPVTCEFVFVNEGSSPVAITGARASCGCTTPKFDRSPVAPGDTGRITVSYDPAGRPGRFEKTVAVDFSEDVRKVKLRIKGTVVGSAASVAQRFPVQCASGLQLGRPVAMIGDVDKGKMRSVFVQAYNRSERPLTPAATDLPPYIDVAVSPETVAPGEHTSFVFYFRSDKCPLYGFVSDTIRIVTDGVDGCPLPVTAVVREDFSRLTDKQMKKSPIAHIAEPTIDFGRLDAPTATRTARIKNIGKSTLELRRVYTADPGIKVEVDRMSVKPGKEATVTITVDRSQLRGAILNARISVIANDPMSPVQNIRAVGTL